MNENGEEMFPTEEFNSEGFAKTLESKKPIKKGNKTALALLPLLVILSLIYIVLPKKSGEEKEPPEKIVHKQEDILEDGTYKGNLSCDKLDILLGQGTDPVTAKIICVNGEKREIALELTGVYANHYHNHALIDGNLYLLRRVSYDSSQDKTRTDELWKFTKDMRGKRLYSGKIVGFMVSEEKDLVILKIIGGFVFLDKDGAELNKIETDKLSLTSVKDCEVSLYKWGPDAFWFRLSSGPGFVGLTKVGTETFKVEKYNILGLAPGSEYALNVYSEKLAYSTYPIFFDVDSVEMYEKSDSKVSLYVYDLKTKGKRFIATSTAKPFSPKWLNKVTLEYNDPDNSDRNTKTIN